MDYYTPTKVVFGKDAELRTGEMLREQNATDVLIHYGSERVVKSGLMKKITDQLDKEGIRYTLLQIVESGFCDRLARLPILLHIQISCHRYSSLTLLAALVLVLAELFALAPTAA